MCGMDEMQESLFTTVKLEDFVPADHPLRPIRLLVNEALKRLNGLFGVIYADTGRASIAPEKLLRALLLQVFYSVRSERMLMERMRYNLLVRWTGDRGRRMGPLCVLEEPRAVARARIRGSVLYRSHEFGRQTGLAVQRAFFGGLHAASGMGESQELLHEGRLVRWTAASGGRNPGTDWKGTRRCNDMLESSTDPDARFFKKSKKSPAILCFHGHIPMEHRSGLVVGAVVSHAGGFAERASGLRLLDCVPGIHAKTVGADKAYDTRDFVSDCCARNVTPHVARNDERIGGSAIDGRTSRHAGYRTSQVIRKRIVDHFGEGKTIGRIPQTAYRGIKRVDQHFTLTVVASNLTRMARVPGVMPQGALQ